MSKAALREFLATAAIDAQVQEELRALTAEDGDSIRSDELVKVAVRHGHDVTVDDVRATAGELEDAKLDAIAGGAGYLKVGDIKGESTDDGHKDWIDILSYSVIVSYNSL